MSESCGSCRFSRLYTRIEPPKKRGDPDVTVAERKCHFNPPDIKPVPVANGAVQLLSMSPTVGEEWWCGKYEAGETLQ